MPVNKQAVLAAIRRNPQAFANAIMEQQVAAMMNPGNPGAIDPNAVTLEDIENMVREQAEASGDPNAVRIAEGAIAMNRTFMGGVMGGMVQMRQELDALKAKVGNVPNNGKAIAKPARNAGGMARRHG